jgi:predicted MFS family arabinose efflux permease
MSKSELAKSALRFVLIVGVVNLFADMTYEGGRAITGPFLGSLGASATVVGIVAGLGELFGYSLRSVSGYFADRTRAYWPIAFLGYAINMLAVPALALAGNWPVAAALIIAERTGRAVRKPAMETMLSHAGKSIGVGWAFGLNTALDQTGATVGPLIAALILYLKHGYRSAFAILLIPAIATLVSLVSARILHPRPHELEKSEPRFESATFSNSYWIYVLAGALIAAGFADFSLIGFHFQKQQIVPVDLIPVFYAAAMATGAITSPLLGRAFDRFGSIVAALVFFATALFAPLVFLGGRSSALAGIILWGFGLGAEDSLFKALLVDLVPNSKRSTAFGLFDTAFGVAWFGGSAAMGFLYDRSILALVIFSVAVQLLALPLFFVAKSKVTAAPRG